MANWQTTYFTIEGEIKSLKKIKRAIDACSKKNWLAKIMFRFGRADYYNRWYSKLMMRVGLLKIDNNWIGSIMRMFGIEDSDKDRVFWSDAKIVERNGQKVLEFQEDSAWYMSDNIWRLQDKFTDIGVYYYSEYENIFDANPICNDIEGQYYKTRFVIVMEDMLTEYEAKSFDDVKGIFKAQEGIIIPDEINDTDSINEWLKEHCTKKYNYTTYDEYDTQPLVFSVQMEY